MEIVCLPIERLDISHRTGMPGLSIVVPLRNYLVTFARNKKGGCTSVGEPVLDLSTNSGVISARLFKRNRFVSAAKLVKECVA